MAVFLSGTAPGTSFANSPRACPGQHLLETGLCTARTEVRHDDSVGGAGTIFGLKDP